MNTPDQTFRLQGQLSTWSGTKKIAGWLAIIAFVLCAIGVALILFGQERSIVTLASPFLLIAICLRLRTRATKKITEIEAKLSS